MEKSYGLGLWTCAPKLQSTKDYADEGYANERVRPGEHAAYLADVLLVGRTLAGRRFSVASVVQHQVASYEERESDAVNRVVGLWRYL